ncbi:MAG: sugar fermentation stimulation protein [Firmicutes bacterium]|nr:sugar fermentation stimulation protein [Bacillota bacterium]
MNMKKDALIFESPLTEGVIQKRKSQFTMIVEVCGKILSCHCPTTGRIGNLDISGRPCLLSKSSDPNRKTLYTVEAISLNRPEDKNKSWIGINQNAANRYVEHYLVNGGFEDMVGQGNIVLREQFIGISKLDFLVGNTYIEVKTPLQHLQIEYPDYIRTKKNMPFSSTARFVKHITELTNSLQNHQRAILLICFIYDNPGFRIIERSINYEQVKEAVNRSTKKGVESWQANFKINQSGITLEKYFRLDI